MYHQVSLLCFHNVERVVQLDIQEGFSSNPVRMVFQLLDIFWSAVVKQADLSSTGLLHAVGNAERERAAAPSEAPLSEWEVTRIKPDFGAHLTTQVLLANSDEAKAALQVCFHPNIV